MSEVSIITKIAMRAFAFVLMIVSVIGLTVSNFDTALISFGMAMVLVVISLFIGTDEE